MSMGGISLGRVTVILLLGRAAGYALSLLASVVLVRSLGPDRLGEFAYAMGLTGVFGLLPNLGISTIVMRKLARDPNTGAGVAETALRAQALVACGVVVVIPTLAALLPIQPVPVWYIILAAAQLAVGSLSWPYLAAIGARSRYDLLALSEGISGIIGTALILAAALFRGGVAAFLWVHLASAVCAALTARRIALPHLPTHGNSPPRLGDLFRQGLPFGGGALVQSLYTRLDLVMLGQMAPTGVLGLYSAAYKPINMATSFGGTVAGTLFPLMAQEPSHGAPVAFTRAMRGLGVVGPAFALFLTGVGASLLQYFFGSEYVPAAPILVILGWSVAANWLYAPLSISLQAGGHEHAWLGSLIFGTALNAAVNFWAIPRWGGVGAAVATLISETALLVCGILLFRRRLRVSPETRTAFSILCATVVGALFLAFVRSAGLSPLLTTTGALLLYGGLLVAFGVIGYEDASLVLEWTRQAFLGERRG